MTALAKAREVQRWGGTPGILASYGVAASQTIYGGALVGLNAAGYAIPATDTASITVVGVAEATVKSSATAGEDKVRIRRGAVQLFANASGANALTIADIGSVCYVADDQTVQDNGAANDVKVGVMLQLDDAGVWVHVGVAAP